MEDDLEQSLDAESEFVPIPSMGQSLIGTSEKVYFQNASTINRQELEAALKTKDKKTDVKDVRVEEESQNEFLQVGKWKKAKQSTMNKDMQTVKQQVNQIITQTRWRKKENPQPIQQPIADQTWVPEKAQKQEEEQEEIEDQTQEEEKESSEGESDEDEQQQEDEEQQEEEEEQQQQEEEEEEEQQQEEEEEEEGEGQGQELEGEDEKEKIEEKQRKTKTCHHSSHQENDREVSEVLKSNKSKESSSQVSYDDRTDAQSEMKRTEYLPGKWSKKEIQQKEDPWKRKEIILLRIAKLVQ